MISDIDDLGALNEEALHPDLEPWVEDGEDWGPMLRHPLVYSVPLILPGLLNRQYAAKTARLAEAKAKRDWHTCIWLHERPYRFTALIDYVIGRDMDGFVIPLQLLSREYDELVTSVWIDSENIQQHMDEWNALLRNGAGIWLGGEEGRKAFDALPDPIPAWRGGCVGDWSWTTDPKVGDFFARRSGYDKRHALIPKADVFGYLPQRGESELMVKMTDERRPLVYPNEFA